MEFVERTPGFWGRRAAQFLLAGSADWYLLAGPGRHRRGRFAALPAGPLGEPSGSLLLCSVGVLGRLQSAHPDRYSQAHLRTLQRRVQQWRGIMAKKLVYGSADEAVADPGVMPELALVGNDPRC